MHPKGAFRSMGVSEPDDNDMKTSAGTVSGGALELYPCPGGLFLERRWRYFREESGKQPNLHRCWPPPEKIREMEATGRWTFNRRTRQFEVVMPGHTWNEESRSFLPLWVQQPSLPSTASPAVWVDIVSVK